MKKSYLLRVLLLAVALVGVAGATLWAVQRSWQRSHALERRLTVGFLESFRLSDEFQIRLHNLNNTLLRFEARRGSAALDEFKKASTALSDWIDQHDPNINKASELSTACEQQLFHELNNAFDEYLAAATAVVSDPRPTANSSSFLDRFEQESRRLFNLGTQLAEAHRLAQDSFLAGANSDLARLRAFMMASVLVMLGVVGVLGFVLYQSLVRPLRMRLVQSQVLLERQEKLATLGTLAAGIAHEIRNPLTSIKARLYTLGKHIKDNPRGCADADVIGEEIGRLERIVQDVLSFARPTEPQKAVLPADKPLREVHSLMAGTLEKSGVHLVLEPPEQRFISMDGALIKQVLINLIRNAAEATSNGGTVTLRVRSSRAKLKGAERPVAILEVADTGSGIPAEVEARLFDPFFTTKAAGTGLGLSIAARIVEKHGGVLQYQTQAGRGTTFGIVLPETIVPSANTNSTNHDKEIGD